MREQLILLDFDGTLCLGDDPVLFYAEQADLLLAEKGQVPDAGGEPDAAASPESGGIRAAVERAFAQNTLLAPEIRFDSTGWPLGVDQESIRSAAAQEAGKSKAHPTSWPLQDGYQLVQLLCVQAGLSDEEAGVAFKQGRRELLARGLEHSDVHAPEGVAELLAELREAAGVVLITNSPADAFGPWLEHLGLPESFDAVINGAQKPFGMSAAVRAAQERAGLEVDPQRIISVGDIWRNDLEHVDAQGGTTVLIDRFGTGLGEPTHRVQEWRQVPELLTGMTRVNIE